MKTSRLLLYGIAGIIGGLLVENGMLRIKQKAAQKIRKVKKDMSRKTT